MFREIRVILCWPRNLTVSRMILFHGVSYLVGWLVKPNIIHLLRNWQYGYKN